MHPVAFVRDTLAFPLLSTNFCLSQPGDLAPKTVVRDSSSASSSSTGGGFGLYSVVAIGGLIAYFAYQYLQADAGNQAQGSA